MYRMGANKIPEEKASSRISNKSWTQHSTKQEQYGHLPPVFKFIQIRRTRLTGCCCRIKYELKNIPLCIPTRGCASESPPTKLIYLSYMWTLGVVWRTCWARRMIGIDEEWERESQGRLDDGNEDIYNGYPEDRCNYHRWWPKGQEYFRRRRISTPISEHLCSKLLLYTAAVSWRTTRNTSVQKYNLTFSFCDVDNCEEETCN